MKKIILGQRVWVIPMNNELRYDPNPFEAIVTKIGNKYFEIEAPKRHFSNKFNIDTLKEKTEYSSDYFVYESKQAWLDKEETLRLKKVLIEKISNMKLEQLVSLNEYC